jgi:hypothetical protein
MAKVVGVFNTAHSPFLYMNTERWPQVRASRALREDVPLDDEEACREKAQRVKKGFKTLREKLASSSAMTSSSASTSATSPPSPSTLARSSTDTRRLRMASCSAHPTRGLARSGRSSL